MLACRQARRDGCTIPQTIGLSILIVLVAAVLSAGFAYTYTGSKANYFTDLNQGHAEGLRREGKTEAEIAAMTASHAIGTPKGFALSRFRNAAVFGVIGTLLGAAVFARKPKTP